MFIYTYICLPRSFRSSRVLLGQRSRGKRETIKSWKRGFSRPFFRTIRYNFIARSLRADASLATKGLYLSIGRWPRDLLACRTGHVNTSVSLSAAICAYIGLGQFPQVPVCACPGNLRIELSLLPARWTISATVYSSCESRQGPPFDPLPATCVPVSLPTSSPSPATFVGSGFEKDGYVIYVLYNTVFFIFVRIYFAALFLRYVLTMEYEY